MYDLNIYIIAELLLNHTEQKCKLEIAYIQLIKIIFKYFVPN